MNLWFRLLFTLLWSWRRPPCSLTHGCSTPFRVWPTDLDTAVHVNNGVYLSLMDIARLDFMIRTGTFATLLRNKWFPVVAAETIQFHRALLPFERFYIETRLIGWDERTFYVRQRFSRLRVDGELVADAIVRGIMVRRSGGTIPMPELLKAIGTPPRPEPMPAWIEDWARAMDANRERLKQQKAPAEFRDR